MPPVRIRIHAHKNKDSEGRVVYDGTYDGTYDGNTVFCHAPKGDEDRLVVTAERGDYDDDNSARSITSLVSDQEASAYLRTAGGVRSLALAARDAMNNQDSLLRSHFSYYRHVYLLAPATPAKPAASPTQRAEEREGMRQAVAAHLGITAAELRRDGGDEGDCPLFRYGNEEDGPNYSSAFMAVRAGARAPEHLVEFRGRVGNWDIYFVLP